MTEGRPKKQIPLRLSAKLYDQIAAWAEDDFRSVNGQIYQTLVPVALALGIGIGLVGSFITTRKHLKV